MENVDRVVAPIEKEISDVEKKMRKLRYKSQSLSQAYIDLREELATLKAAWDILT